MMRGHIDVFDNPSEKSNCKIVSEIKGLDCLKEVFKTIFNTPEYLEAIDKAFKERDGRIKLREDLASRLESYGYTEQAIEFRNALNARTVANATQAIEEAKVKLGDYGNPSGLNDRDIYI